MNREMKKLIGKFLFTSVLISCLTALAAGSTTVSERGNYNIFFTKYAVMSFSPSSEKLEAKLQENRLTVKVPVKRIESQWEKYACLTPISPIHYLTESIRELF